MSSFDLEFYINRGTENFFSGNLRDALTDYTKAIILSPSYREAYFARGLVHFHLQSYLEAIADYSEVIRLDPQADVPYINRGNAFNALQNYQAAIKDYTEAIRLNPYSALAFFNRGNVYQKLFDYLSAITDFTNYLQLEPQSELAYYNRGTAYHTLQNYQAAIADHTKAIRLNPENANAFVYRGSSYHALQNYQAAIADHTEAIRLAPQNALAYYNLGTVHEDLQNYQSAIADFTDAIFFNPEYVAAYNNRGNIHYAIKNYSAAIKDYTEAIRLDPHYARAYSNRGVVFTDLQEYQAALADHTKCIQLNPQSAKAYNNRGKVYLHLHDYQAALKDHNESIHLEPKNSVGYFNRGIVYYALQNYQAAIVDQTKAIQLDPLFALAYYCRGLFNYDLKDYQAAIADQTKAIQLNPQYVSPYYNRGAAFFAIGSFDEAQSDYTRYIFTNQIERLHLNRMLSFFQEYADAPFVLLRLLKYTPNIEYLYSYKNLLLELENKTRPILDYLDYWQVKGWAMQHPSQYKYIIALCQYFMGDTAEAFRIIDEEIDQMYPLNLMGHYYYVQSAIFSSLPDAGIAPLLEDAIEAAMSTDDSNDSVDLYYAGLILYSFGKDNEKAIRCFKRAKGLLPALYMLWLLAPLNQKESLKREIQICETTQQSNRSFANGLSNRQIENRLSSHWEAMQHYCFYQEIALAIQELYEGNDVFKISPFYEFWQFKISFKEQEEVISFQKAYKAEQVLKEIEIRLETMKQWIDHVKLEDNINLSVNSIIREFEALQVDAEKHSGEKLEARLAGHIYETALNKKLNRLNIHGFQYLETHIKFASYFYLLGKINTRTTVHLFLYALHSANRFDPNLLSSITETAVEDSIMDAVKGSDVAKTINLSLTQAIGTAFATTWGAPLATILISFSVKALWLMIKDSQQEKPKEYELPGIDYAKFKQSLAEQLLILKLSGASMPEFEKMMN